MTYFAYGSNMSSARLQNRVPNAKRVGTGRLTKHDLRFHKKSQDGSGKCDAFHTDDTHDQVWGVLFEIDPHEKPELDKAEGLGYGYNEKTVTILTDTDEEIQAFTYYALQIASDLKPYCWYKNHVIIGARESGLPESHIQKIESIPCIKDPDPQRAAREWAMHTS